MEKELQGTVDAVHVERTIGSSPKKEKDKSHKHRGLFHLHHHSKDDDKEDDKKKEGSKREKIAAAMVGVGAALKKIKHPRHGGSGGNEEGQGEGEAEEEEEEEEEGDDGGDEEGGGKFSAFISMIAEAFEE